MVEEGLRASFGREDPRGLWSLVWAELRVRIEDLEVNHSDLLVLSERELEKKVQPDALISSLRIKFWEEYYEVQDRGLSGMRLARILKRVCSDNDWERHVLRKPKNLVWVLREPVEYQTAMKDMLQLGLEEMRFVMTLPLMKKRKNKKGEESEYLDSTLLNHKLKIIQMADQRVMGSVIQRLAIKQEISSRVQQIEAPKQDIMLIENELESLQRSIDSVRNREPLLIESVPRETIGEEVGSGRS